MAPNVMGITTRPRGAIASFLLVHGFCASSDELGTLGKYLADNGHASFAVQLAGHGTTPEDLKATSWRDWLESARKGLNIIQSWGSKYIFVVGFSMGGLLSILLSSEEKDIDGLILIAPALKISGFTPKLVPILKYLIKYREIDVEAVQRVYDVKRTKYEREPVSAYQEFFRLQKVARKRMMNVTIPTIILQGEEDKSIDKTSGRMALNGISSEKKELQMITGAEHVISCHPTRTVAYPLILDFVERVMD
ncbi:MAG: alpha/beta hydrolase [Candidatus Thorarchaeota archaeon SMTZ1-45]|nr:MAG: hypothetical protein AM325_09520 [Candidatus Thorarchaeota archaeon SMTZ1-45]